MSSLIYDRKSINENLSKLLECYRCKRSLKTPVVSCAQGHASCLNSCSRNRKCICGSNRIGRFTIINQIIAATKEKDCLEKLYEILECPVCYRQIKKFKLCTEGHAICLNCAQITFQCPLCRSKYDQSQSLLEKIIKAVHVNLKCKNAQKGCGGVYKYTKLFHHEYTCEYNEFRCLSEGCFWKGKAVDMGQHWENSHQHLVLKENLLMIRRKSNDLLMFKQFGKTYWIMYTFDSNGLYLNCQEHSTETKERFVLSLEYKKAEFTKELIPMTVNLKKTLERNECIYIPKKSLSEFEINNCFICSINIMGNPRLTNGLVEQIFPWLLMCNIFYFAYKIAK